MATQLMKSRWYQSDIQKLKLPSSVSDAVNSWSSYDWRCSASIHVTDAVIASLRNIRKNACVWNIAPACTGHLAIWLRSCVHDQRLKLLMLIFAIKRYSWSSHVLSCSTTHHVSITHVLVLHMLKIRDFAYNFNIPLQIRMLRCIHAVNKRLLFGRLVFKINRQSSSGLSCCLLELGGLRRIIPSVPQAPAKVETMTFVLLQAHCLKFTRSIVPSAREMLIAITSVL